MVWSSKVFFSSGESSSRENKIRRWIFSKTSEVFSEGGTPFNITTFAVCGRALSMWILTFRPFHSGCFFGICTRFSWQKILMMYFLLTPFVSLGIQFVQRTPCFWKTRSRGPCLLIWSLSVWSEVQLPLTVIDLWTVWWQGYNSTFTIHPWWWHYRTMFCLPLNDLSSTCKCVHAPPSTRSWTIEVPTLCRHVRNLISSKKLYAHFLPKYREYQLAVLTSMSIPIRW